MELIIALLFFSISGAVIVKVFAAADKRSRLNAEKEQAMICAQSIAEVYSELANVDETLQVVFSEKADRDDEADVYTIKLDSGYHPDLNGTIKMNASEKREKTASGELSRLTVSFVSNKGDLYSLECAAYIPDGGDADA
ncbi:MAG: hypothetical protein K2J80_07810 [Oscillospiraceae bacterium]|nr:hypothetical protein [Oscillospiraceae bacterium]